MLRCVQRIRSAGGIWSLLLVFGFGLLVGCGENVRFNNPLAEKSAKQAAPKRQAAPPETAPPKKTDDKEAQARRAMIRTTSMRGGGGGSTFSSSGNTTTSNASVADNLGRLRREIESSVDFAPTMIVWMVDATPSAAELRGEWADAAKRLYSDFATNGLPGGKPAEQLSTAIVAFGEKPQFVLEQPTTDFALVGTKLGEIPTDESGKETTFATVSQLLEKYGPLKSQQSRELLLVVVSDEAGDDLAQVDAAIAKANSTGVRVYGIGVPAPLGRKMAEVPAMETRSDGQPAMVQGPETRYSQHPDMKFSYGGFGGDDIDSGYGPFGLTYLAYKTRGAFLVSRLRNASWPGNAMRFEDSVMLSYPPQYLSEQEYQAKLQENKALAALHRAAQQPQVEAMSYPGSQFQTGDEARLKNALDRAQRTSARLGPLIDVIYEPLAEGEKDRAKITDKRWQASYDLALGRAAAIKARIDGYNQMLAILKGGRTFQDPSHDTWILEPADTLEEAGSRLERLRLQAKEYLQRVIDEHPGTPWAYLAERELESPIGWKWVEG